MKTNFKIVWVDDNLSDPEMESSTRRLGNKLNRKNGFSLKVEDIYSEVAEGDFEQLLLNLAASIDLSNSVDLIVIDYQLGNNATGEKIAKKFRDRLPSADILFYSGKLPPEELRKLIAQENVDGVNCVARNDIVEDGFTVIENIIDRSHKISTLRGLILNSVCEMDHMIKQILCKFSSINAIHEEKVKNEAIRLIKPYNDSARRRLKRLQVHDLLNQRRMMSSNLYKVLDKVKSDLDLSPLNISMLNTYQQEIIFLRNTAAHSKEATCETTGQSMLENDQVKYMRGDIDGICQTIVNHEINIQSILKNMN